MKEELYEDGEETFEGEETFGVRLWPKLSSRFPT